MVCSFRGLLQIGYLLLKILEVLLLAFSESSLRSTILSLPLLYGVSMLSSKLLLVN